MICFFYPLIDMRWRQEVSFLCHKMAALEGFTSQVDKQNYFIKCMKGETELNRRQIFVVSLEASKVHKQNAFLTSRWFLIWGHHRPSRHVWLWIYDPNIFHCWLHSRTSKLGYMALNVICLSVGVDNLQYFSPFTRRCSEDGKWWSRPALRR